MFAGVAHMQAVLSCLDSLYFGQYFGVFAGVLHLQDVFPDLTYVQGARIALHCLDPRAVGISMTWFSMGIMKRLRYIAPPVDLVLLPVP